MGDYYEKCMQPSDINNPCPEWMCLTRLIVKQEFDVCKAKRIKISNIKTKEEQWFSSFGKAGEFLGRSGSHVQKTHKKGKRIGDWLIEMLPIKDTQESKGYIKKVVFIADNKEEILEFKSCKAFAEFLGIKESTVYKKMREGALVRGYRLSKRTNLVAKNK